MRVAFNATPLLSPLTGIGNYIVELGNSLSQFDDVDAFSFYRYHWRHERPRVPEDLAGSALALVERSKRWIPRWEPLRSSVRLAVHKVGFQRGLRRNRIDVYHEQNYVPLAYDVPVVITIHDLSWLRFPETHPLDRVRWLERGLPRAIERAAGILVDSEFIRNEVIATFGADPGRVHTAHLGVSAEFHPRCADETRATLEQLGLTHGAYVLTVGTIEPRKNVAHLLDAYARLQAEVRSRFPLVVAGARGWGESKLKNRLSKLTDAGEIRFLDHIGNGKLRDLYSGAGLFVFPSLYEGFGFPPLEAMASGAPVLCSDRASLPEIIGDAAVSFSPVDEAATTAILDMLLKDQSARAAMSQRGIRRAARFSWAKCAAETRAVYLSSLRR
jgi:glycosyltransferase involved in cell wall biosynthesis